MITTQNKEFEDQINHIGELYESIKDALSFVDTKYFITETKVKNANTSLQELCDIACMVVKHVHQPKEN